MFYTPQPLRYEPGVRPLSTLTAKGQLGAAGLADQGARSQTSWGHGGAHEAGPQEREVKPDARREIRGLRDRERDRDRDRDRQREGEFKESVRISAHSLMGEAIGVGNCCGSSPKALGLAPGAKGARDVNCLRVPGVVRTMALNGPLLPPVSA